MTPNTNSGRDFLGKMNQLVVTAFTLDAQRTPNSAHYSLLGVPPVLYNLSHLVSILP